MSEQDPNKPKRPQPTTSGSTPPSARPGYVPAGADKKSTDHTQQTPPAPQPTSDVKRLAAANVSRPATNTKSALSRASRSAAQNGKQDQGQSPKSKRRRTSARIARLFLAFALGVFVLFFVAIVAGVISYTNIADGLPDVKQLAAKQSQFASTKIYDSKGALIVELTDPSNPVAGRRTRVPLADINVWAVKATLATEDPNFGKYNVGFDPIAIVRAIYYVFTEREFVSGGSTITQQVARNLLLTPEERTSRSPMRKLREIVLANELARQYKPNEILEIYLNEINYANLAYGIEAAAQTYFNKPAKDLNLAEASMLAGIPQSPVYWDPVTNKVNTLRRQADVLRLMQKAGYITQDQIATAQDEIRDKTFVAPPPNFTKVAPHFMQYVRQQLDAEYGDKGLYRDGLRVYTSLDQDIQHSVENAIMTQVATLADKHVTNGAAVVIDPMTGEIKAMAGSADFFNDAISGQVNVALSLRQPGSSVKPFNYLAALEKGWTPATLFWDKPTTFTNQYGQTFTPKNYDSKFHGPMLMREALARSMNIPAVETLNFVTVPEFLKMADRVGLNFPPNPQYGLAITLGGADARLLDLTSAYAVLASNGVRRQATAITRVESATGTLIRDYRQTQGQLVLRPEHVWLMTNILSDNSARAKSFGVNNVLHTKYPSAVKTGTTNDYRDNLTVGYTPDLVVGVWVGNSDNSEMQGVSGITGAAPIWRQIMDEAHTGKTAQEFAPPQGVVAVEICELGGHVPSQSCPTKHNEYFKSDQLPLPADENLEKAVAANDPNLAANPQSPLSQASTSSAPQSPDILISQPNSGASAPRGILSIRGTINPPGFQQYVVEYGAGDNPGEWKWISGPHLAPVINDQLTMWNIGSLPAGRYTIRVTVNTLGGQHVGYTRFDVGA